MKQYFNQIKWSPIKNSWLSRILFSVKYSTGLKMIAEIVSRLIGVVVISYFLGFFIWIIFNLFGPNNHFDWMVILGFILFVGFDLFKFVKEKNEE